MRTLQSNYGLVLVLGAVLVAGCSDGDADQDIVEDGQTVDDDGTQGNNEGGMQCETTGDRSPGDSSPGETTVGETSAGPDDTTGPGQDDGSNEGELLDGEAARAYNVEVLVRVAEPVLEALSENELRERMPVHEWELERAGFTHTEAFARTLAGVAPWIELGPDNTPEGIERARFITLARQSLINATDPESPDFLPFDETYGDQTIVEGAYLASALMAAPSQLWDPLTAEQQENVLATFRRALAIENKHNNNWYLFPAMMEAALWDLTGEADTDLIEDAILRFEQDWYLGDGTYSDGPDFAWDYYNSYVIHPMMLQILQVAQENGSPIGDSLGLAMARALRYAEVLERLISPEGTFPVMGRSSAYRFAAFYHLSYMALRRDLPQEVEPGAVRSGVTLVVRNMIEAPGTFDAEGWLQLGAVGHQPGLQEVYNATGSLYVCLTGLVYLGLPASDEFWTAPPRPWTQRLIWAGVDVPRDESLEDRD